jgi:prefoldin subunit 5
MSSTQEFLLARIEALEKEIKNLNSDMNLHLSTLEAIIRDLEVELKLENEKKRSLVVGLQLQIEDLHEDAQKLTDVIKGLDPTNPILQHLTL